MANQKANKSQTASNPKVHHFVRTFFASLFGFFAISLIVTSILVIWLNRTLTDTDQFVKTVAPLVTKPGIQDFVVSSVSDALLENKEAPINDIAKELLGSEQVAAVPAEQLKDKVRPIVEENLKTVITSEEFAQLWEDSNRSIHSQLITQIKIGEGDFKLNFRPIILAAIDQLGKTKLSFVKDKIELEENIGLVDFEFKGSGPSFEGVRDDYYSFQKAILAIVGFAVICLALCVLISVHHLKTLRRVALSVGIFCALLAVSLSAASLVKPRGSNLEQQEAGAAIVDAITYQLRLTLIIVAVICIGAAVGSKIYAVIKAKKIE